MILKKQKLLSLFLLFSNYHKSALIYEMDWLKFGANQFLETVMTKRLEDSLVSGL